MKTLFVIFLAIINSFLLWSCEQNKSKKESFSNKEVVPKSSMAKTDTLKRNEQIVYNITKDTIIENYQISINNKNIDNSYINQNLKLNDSILVQNFYPEMESTVTIKNDGNIFFHKIFRKNDLPKGTFSELLKYSVMKDFKFNLVYPDTKEISFLTTMQIPNTDFENDFELIVKKDGKFDLRWIDYESE